ncbi:hypothetical protein [Paenisporosarcina sp. TG20]|uniref:hypothetical protein n=1 Tax=Paenisporosarcina sp. TG20 TaxID=1211706 RepID=UPI000313593A|nr:hypothetical protein [Paenisporosarcina sp. TG20]
MQLQQFVTEVIEGLGGVVVPVEYALCQVLVPEEYKGYFQDKTELELAFDFEVAQENTQSEFVTFGSFILEQVLTIANQKAVSTLRFVEVERQILANPMKKMKELWLEESGKIEILDERSVMGVWAVFQFHITFISEEKEETSEQVWINLITGEPSESMKQKQNSIIYMSNPLYNYPIPAELNMEEAFVTAYNHVNNASEGKQKQRKQDQQLQKDIDRIGNYYKELLMESDKKAKRTGLSKEKIEEITTKSRAINVEMEKQIEEIKKKYHGHTEITIVNGILYFVPILQYSIEVLFRSKRTKQTLYYNPITKQFD